jgi:hypothetical protein
MALQHAQPKAKTNTTKPSVARRRVRRRRRCGASADLFGGPSAGGIQAKLRVNQPGDALEQDADRVADRIVSMPQPTGRLHLGPPRSAALHGDGGTVQRACSACEEENLQKSPVPASRGSLLGGAFQSSLRSTLARPGEPLPSSVQHFMAPRFGADLGGVRLHRGDDASALAKAAGARAFTLGSNVVFGRGEFRPSSREGQRLIAHELTHVLQQRSGMKSAESGVLQRQVLPNPPSPSPTPSDEGAHECGEFGPPAREADEDHPKSALPPLVYRQVTRKRGRRPSVGYGQRLLNQWLKAYDAGQIGCATGADPKKLAKLRKGIRDGQLVVDCRFGPQTELATTLFQECEQLNKMDGKIGDETWQALEAATGNTPGEEPERCPEIECPFAPTQPAVPSPPTPPLEPQRIDTGLANHALCRGACGIDCPPSCVAQDNITLCVHDLDSDCHAECTYTGVTRCPTHEGCREHDACYDACVAGGEMDLCSCPVAACAVGMECDNPCHCACDRGCCTHFDKLDCFRWSQGSATPRDGLFNYAASASAGPASRGRCP